MQGKIIVIEGLDGTGKHTQSELLYKKLSKEYNKVKLLSFPNYNNDSSYFVSKYLHGGIDKDPNNVNPYAASMFFATDRYISYIKEWKKYYDEGYIIICDRYVLSNAIYQLPKLETDADKNRFLTWLYETEFNNIGLPEPDLTIYLSLDTSISNKLLDKRYNHNDGMRDIHETKEFQEQCSRSMDFISNHGFIGELLILICNNENGDMYSVEDIHDDIYFYTKEILE